MATTETIEIQVGSEKEMIDLGKLLSPALYKVSIVTLTGDLGAGKTTLVRGILRGRHYRGAVKSPTFTLVEPYELEAQFIYHFDLYRLNDPEELEFMGAREYLHGDGLCLIEWPEKGSGFLPEPDVTVTIKKSAEGRMVTIRFPGDRGKSIADNLMRSLKTEQGVQCR